MFARVGISIWLVGLIHSCEVAQFTENQMLVGKNSTLTKKETAKKFSHISLNCNHLVH